MLQSPPPPSYTALIISIVSIAVSLISACVALTIARIQAKNLAIATAKEAREAAKHDQEMADKAKEKEKRRIQVTTRIEELKAAMSEIRYEKILVDQDFGKRLVENKQGHMQKQHEAMIGIPMGSRSEEQHKIEAHYTEQANLMSRRILREKEDALRSLDANLRPLQGELKVLEFEMGAPPPA